MSANEIMLLVLAVGSFFIFRFYVCKIVPRSPKTQAARLLRIRNASLIFQILIAISLAVGLYAVLAFLCGWPCFSDRGAHVVVSPGHVYTSLAEMPENVLAWVLVKTGLDFAAAAVLFLLFGLYRRGIMFSARNVLYIRFQGYYLILGFVVNYLMQSALHDMNLSTTSLFAGFAIIFIAWVMDEGRKIQEEQQLTI